MASKRKYPEIPCKNCGHIFTPKDARQEYCKKQCRIDFNNDKKKLVNRPFNEFQKKVKNNEMVLIKAAVQLKKIGSEKISMDILLVAGYIPEICFEKLIDKKTGNLVFWNINHGLAPIEKEKSVFKILKR